MSDGRQGKLDSNAMRGTQLDEVQTPLATQQIPSSSYMQTAAILRTHGEDDAGADCTAALVETARVDGLVGSFMLKGGTPGASYRLRMTAETDAGERIVEMASLAVDGRAEDMPATPEFAAKSDLRAGG